MSKQFTFNEENTRKSLKVLAWSVTSAVVAFLITLVSSTNVPPEYIALVPLVNVILYAIKEFATEQTR